MMYFNVFLVCFITFTTILNPCSEAVDVSTFLGTNPNDVLNSNSTYCANGTSSIIVNAARAAASFVTCNSFVESPNLEKDFLRRILCLDNATYNPIESGDFVNANLNSLKSDLKCCLTNVVELDAAETQQVELCLLETVFHTNPNLTYYVNSFLVCMEATTGYARTNLISLTLIDVLIYYLIKIKDGKFLKDNCGSNAAKAFELLQSYEICRQTVE